MSFNKFLEKKGELMAKWQKNSLISRKNSTFAKEIEGIHLLNKQIKKQDE